MTTRASDEVAGLGAHACDVCGITATEAWVDTTHEVDAATRMVSYRVVGKTHYGCKQHGRAFWLVFTDRLECPNCSSELTASKAPKNGAIAIWCTRCQPDSAVELLSAPVPRSYLAALEQDAAARELCPHCGVPWDEDRRRHKSWCAARLRWCSQCGSPLGDMVDVCPRCQ